MKNTRLFGPWVPLCISAKLKGSLPPLKNCASLQLPGFGIFGKKHNSGMKTISKSLGQQLNYTVKNTQSFERTENIFSYLLGEKTQLHYQLQ